jgi:hypothetical protein
MSTLDAIKAGLATALATFVTTFLLTVQNWIGQGDLPDWSALKAAALSAGLAALVGLVNFGGRWAQGRAGVGQVPTYVKVTKV